MGLFQGIPEGDPVSIQTAYPGEITAKETIITGVAVGNAREASEVLDLAARGVIRPHYKIEPLENLTNVSHLLLYFPTPFPFHWLISYLDTDVT